jgi:phosphate acetyltransferase
MNVLDNIYMKAKGLGKRVAFPEGTNDRLMAGAEQITKLGLATCVLVGDEKHLRSLCEERAIDAALFEFADTNNSDYQQNIIDQYLQLPNTLFGSKSLAKRVKDPLYMALIMEAVGDVDCTFAGIDYTTEEVILAAKTIIGLADGITTVSSFGILEIEGYDGREGNLIGFGDSAVCVDPNAEELASIAISCCDSAHKLLDWTPHCAMLSYSTCGSGSGPLVNLVVEARDIAQKLRPDLDIDGEFQLDAAVNKVIGAKKVKRESSVAGRANIIVWPNLNVGNIGVKLVLQFAKSRMYGPIYQGFKKVVCDCSRGATVNEVVDGVAMSAVLCRGTK